MTVVAATQPYYSPDGLLATVPLLIVGSGYRVFVHNEIAIPLCRFGYPVIIESTVVLVTNRLCILLTQAKSGWLAVYGVQQLKVTRPRKL